MRRANRIVFFLVVIAQAALALPADASKTAAPYFEAFASGQRVERLPLAMTKVDVLIAGSIAEVSLNQVYENRGDVPVEAVYVFPASANASVHAVKMTVGSRVIRAVLRTRDEARKTYEQARSDGKTATLLEQQDVGAFRMRVANVLPGDRITVEMEYVELLVPTKGIYEFFFPNTAPMQKYERPGDSDSSMPSSGDSEVVDFGFDMRVRVLSALPIASIESPSHRIDLVRNGADEAEVTLANPKRAGARDFVLRYSMLGDAVQTGVLLQEGAEENFFLLMAQPPRSIVPAAIPPREYIFVVDVSGSMNGRPLDVSRQLVSDLFAGLRDGDRFNVILFAGASEVMSETSQPATPAVLARALATLDGKDASGGTELADALEKAYAIPTVPGMARSVIVVTDGAIAAGGDVSQLIFSHLSEASVFVFGIGDHVSRAVIERIARAGQGEPFIVEQMSAAESVAARFREYIERPLLTQVHMDAQGIDLGDIEPPRIPDLFVERPITLIGKYRGPASGTLTIRGHSGLEQVGFTVDLSKARRDLPVTGLAQLWARRRIDRLEDADCPLPCPNPAEREKEITDIGLRYGILTPYTSFVAVTEEVRTIDPAVPVQQPAMARDTPASFAESAIVAGVGFSPAFASRGLVATMSAARAMIPEHTPSNAALELGGHRMQRVDDGWRDVDHRADAKVLRVRRGSDAFRMLLALRPGLADVLALEGKLLIAFGGYSIEVTPLGFSDYPERTLRRALGMG